MNDVHEPAEKEITINLTQFYFETPLYTPVKKKDIEGDCFNDDVEGFNPFIREPTTYRIERQSTRYGWDDYTFITLYCRRKEHALRFMLYKDDNIIRMEDKIDTLQKWLPSQLKRVSFIYTIFGKGAHELSEEECRVYFAPLKGTILLILDQKIEIKQKEAKDSKIHNTLQKAIKAIKNMDNNS